LELAHIHILLAKIGKSFTYHLYRKKEQQRSGTKAVITTEPVFLDGMGAKSISGIK
jgi:hypothetical protein